MHLPNAKLIPMWNQGAAANWSQVAAANWSQVFTKKSLRDFCGCRRINSNCNRLPPRASRYVFRNHKKMT
ncbi:hypothetical protein LJC08_04365 [Methanimicrococcus sp. OttesenSCG-928-J09]|nr:hypothetical protein [Methanimicrococcus sp. OttesenSCG-928-J09]